MKKYTLIPLLWTKKHNQLHPIKNVVLAVVMVFFTMTMAAHAKEFYVSPSGDDTNPGTLERPFATLTKAKNNARNINEPVNIILRAGTYFLSEPAIFSPQDSRAENAPLCIKSYPGEEVIVSGAVPLKLKWREYKDGIWQAKVDDDVIFDQLYINGIAQRMARYPNYDATAKIFGGVSGDVLNSDRITTWQNPTGGYVHSIHPREWGSYHYLIKGKNNMNELILERKVGDKAREYTNLTAPMHKDSRFVENIFEELDTVNEWFYKTSIKTLYYYPQKESNLSEATVEVPQIKSLIEFRGTEGKPIQNINIEGLTFTQTLRTFKDTSEKMSGGDWYIYRGGAVYMEGTRNCKIEKCHFKELGGNAVFVNNFNRKVEVSECLFENLGASAICFCGDTDARYARMPIDEMVLHPGPKTTNYPANCTVYNNLMHSLGTIEKQVAGVHISMAKDITVSHNTIYNVPRAGINVNDGMWGGHLIEFNDVFNTVLETADHGAFNSWGRDRHHMRQLDTLSREIRDKVVFLDVVSPIVIRNNRFRCDHGWDIDLDDGSSNFHIYNNVLLSGGLKLREGFFRTVENNIIINNSLHPHVWHKNSDDVFTKNILTTSYYPIRMPEVWTKLIDYNVFLDSIALKKSQVGDRDAHSIYSPSDFVNAEAGDYRLKKTSTAFSTGFKNFDMDKFGVVSEKIKAIAQKPPLPELITFIQDDNEVITVLGLNVKNVGMGERSATAMFAEKGVFVVSINEKSKFSGTLKPSDVILSYNLKEVNNVREFQEAIVVPNWNDSLEITVFRRGGGILKIAMKK